LFGSNRKVRGLAVIVQHKCVQAAGFSRHGCQIGSWTPLLAPPLP
jgi:hypothetical protein